MRKCLVLSLALLCAGCARPEGTTSSVPTPPAPAVSASPTDGAEALIKDADELLKDGRANEARYAYNAGLEKYPNNPTMLANRAACEVAVAEYDAAIADLQKAREIQEKAGKKKEAGQARLDLGLVYIRMKKDADALTALDAALPELLEAKDDGVTATAYFYRGSTYLKLKKLNPALQDLTAAVKLEPDEANFHAARSRVLELLHQNLQAAAELEQAASMVKDPETASALRKAAQKLKKTPAHKA